MRLLVSLVSGAYVKISGRYKILISLTKNMFIKKAFLN